MPVHRLIETRGKPRGDVHAKVDDQRLNTLVASRRSSILSCHNTPQQIGCAMADGSMGVSHHGSWAHRQQRFRLLAAFAACFEQ